MGIRLDVYIHDYLVKRDLKATAQAFQAEGKVSSDPVGEMPYKLRISFLLNTLFAVPFCFFEVYVA